MPLVLCPRVVPQASLHFRYPTLETFFCSSGNTNCRNSRSSGGSGGGGGGGSGSSSGSSGSNSFLKTAIVVVKEAETAALVIMLHLLLLWIR